MKEIEKIFLELIRVSVGRADRLSRTPSTAEWEQLLQMAIDQTIAAVLLEGANRLPREQMPPKQVVINWHAMSEKIAADNVRLNHDTVWVADRWKRLGYRNVILKGQGNAQLYPKPLTRAAGDVDIWLDGDRDQIVDYVLKRFPSLEVTRVEMEFPVRKDTAIELHFMPSFLYNPFTNRRLQRYYAEQLRTTEAVHLPDGDIEVPNRKMNLVFQLTHIYRHLFSEGIGLRQLMDYYYLLEHKNMEDTQEQTEVMEVVASIGLRHFSAALMWVLGEVFAMPREHMLTPPDERHGRFLLSEVLQAGNFGHADSRTPHYDSLSRWQRFLWGSKWVMRLLPYYPSEVLWHPWYRITQYIWRRRHGYLGSRRER
ncbi:MAG: nucleotidyltransferase family protein [Bacteroidales bacterium]|nr:nucleotidyltransferase family protein [Candidatus Physcousia equi]